MAQAARVGDRHAQLMRGGGLVVDAGAGLAAAPGCRPPRTAPTVGQRIGEAIARIRIHGTQRGHHRAGGGILLDAGARHREVGRAFVLVADGDADHLGAAQAARVGDRHAQLMRGGGLVVDAGAGPQQHLVADHLEQRRRSASV